MMTLRSTPMHAAPCVFLLRDRHRMYKTTTEHIVNGGCPGTMLFCLPQGGDIVKGLAEPHKRQSHLCKSPDPKKPCEPGPQDPDYMIWYVVTTNAFGKPSTELPTSCWLETALFQLSIEEVRLSRFAIVLSPTGLSEACSFALSF